MIAFAVLLPVISMHIITFNYARLKKKRFDKKFGSLVSGVERAPMWEKWGIFKALYYPVFLFQRLVFACILIYLFPCPVVQIVLFLILHALVSIVANVCRLSSTFWYSNQWRLSLRGYQFVLTKLS